MSRSGYTEDAPHLELYRANVRRTIQGRNGQEFLKELAAAMDAIPTKELIAGELVSDDGVCAIGAVCRARGLDAALVDYDDVDSVANAVGIGRILAAEIEYENDEGNWRSRDETPQERWQRMRKWIDKHLIGINHVGIQSQ